MSDEPLFPLPDDYPLIVALTDMGLTPDEAQDLAPQVHNLATFYMGIVRKQRRARIAFDSIEGLLLKPKMFNMNGDPPEFMEIPWIGSDE